MPKPKYGPTDLILIWSNHCLIHWLSDPFVLFFHSLFNLLIFMLFSVPRSQNTYPLIQSLSDLIIVWYISSIWSICYLIHLLSDPFVIWSIRYPIHLLSDPFVIRSIRYPIHLLSDPFVIWSIRLLFGWGIQVLSRKTIKDKFCEAKLFYSFT